MKTYSKEDISKIYEHYCEYDNEMASEKVVESRDKHSMDLDEYIAAIAEDNFSKGFRYALKIIKNEKMVDI